MSESGVGTTVRLRRCLQRLDQNDPAARAELIEHARRRLTLLAERMFDRWRPLHRFEEADDVLQEAMLRLWQSLEEVGPTSVAQFMALSALQIRRALCDLSRDHCGRAPGAGQRKRQRPAINGAGSLVSRNDPADTTWGPENLARWSEFHAAADQLPEPEKTVFDLLYYHELTQIEAAQVMDVSDRQIRRYWLSARRRLNFMLEGFL